MALEEFEQEVRNYALSKGIKIIEGYLSNTPNKIITECENYKNFLDFIGETDKKLIFLNTSRFEEEFFEDSIEESEDINPFHELNEGYKKYLGKIFQIEIIWINEGFSIIFTKTEDWFDEFVDRENFIKEQIENKKTDEEDRRYAICKECGDKFRDFRIGFGYEPEEYCNKCKIKKEKEAEPKIKDLAKRLSEDLDFIKCKNDIERALFVEEKYPVEFDDSFIKNSSVIQMARALISINKRK